MLLASIAWAAGAFVAACGDDFVLVTADAGAGDGGRDATTGDGRADATPPPDADHDSPFDAGGDVSAGDASVTCSGGGCRTFSSYCDGTKLRSCVCYALHAGELNPTCDGQMTTCIVDPCLGKTAVCEDGGCVVRP